MTDVRARVAFRCACGAPLAAPSDWTGRSLRCPACGGPVALPDQPDEDVARELSRRLGTGAAADPARSGEDRVSARQEVDLGPDPGEAAGGDPPPPSPGLYAARAAAATARRRRILWACVAGGLVVLTALGLWWRHVYHRDFSAAGRMAKRGFGERIEPPPGPPAPTVLDRVHEQERRFEQTRTAEAGADLDRAFREALDAGGLPRRWEAHLSNNYAWFLVTNPFLHLRDPARALDLARRAVDLSQGREAAFLDTLAEAFFASGRVAEAIEAEERAAAADPTADFTGPQLDRFRNAR